jgi:hypothetical protein
MASMAVAITTFHSVSASAVTIILRMPMTTVCISSRVVISSGQRYWFHPYMKRITNSAAMFVTDSGSTVSTKNLTGPAPSSLDASISSSGIVMKNCRKNSVAVADAISGTVKPV